jgi:hypothetical protein
MTELKIIKYYKILSLGTLGLSLAFLMVSSDQAVSEKLWVAIMTNIVFHILYQFVSRMPIGIYQSIETENSRIKRLVLKMMKVFSIVAMVLAVLGTIGFINSIISEERYEQLIMVTIFGALFLGAYNSKLKLNKNIFILLAFLVGCSRYKTNEQATVHENQEPIEFPKFNSQFSNKTTLNVIDKRDRTFELDSTQYSNWTDKYTPYKTDLGRLYSADLYSVQPQLDSFSVLVLRTDADHWFKLHLVTVNSNLELIDKAQISNSWSDLIEQAGDIEIVGKQSMFTNMVSDTEYLNIDIRTTEIINYYSDSTTLEIDSVVTKIELLNNGTFKLTKLDSSRSEKYSGIE